MKIEKMKNHKKIIIGGLITLGIIGSLILTISKAKYKNVESIDLANGIINYKPYDFKIMAMYKNDGGGDVEINEMPSSGYAINEEKSYCYTTDSNNHDSNAKLYTDNKGQHVIANLDKNGKCYLYFDIKNFAEDIIIEDKTGIVQRINFTGIAEGNDTGMYSAPDDYGTSYYFRGLEGSLNNWVKFAGFYWRIIRINGNGTVRMIYTGVASGNPSDANRTGTTTQIGTSMFNHTINDNAYVGYMMGIPLNGTNSTVSNSTISNSTSYEQAHTNTYDSDAKIQIDSWYKTNIADKNLSKYIDTNTGFCNDREFNSGTSGFGTNNTTYTPMGRLNNRQIQTPTLQCANKSRDLFTLSNSSIGNKKLIYPVGLISSDEAVFAGSFNGSINNTYYLYTNQAYWTMSPYNFVYNNWGGGAWEFAVSNSGNIGDFSLSNNYGLRPVINLKADTKFSGSGSATDPYIVI